VQDIRRVSRNRGIFGDMTNKAGSRSKKLEANYRNWESTSKNQTFFLILDHQIPVDCSNFDSNIVAYFTGFEHVLGQVIQDRLDLSAILHHLLSTSHIYSTGTNDSTQ